MILADKIISLRKKNGWSQEELAEKMQVSRQAVSKWESAQAAPNLEKILMLSHLFGVTTDYLLKDEVEDEKFTDGADIEPVKHITLDWANEFLEWRKSASVQIATGVFFCITAVIPLLLLGAASEVPSYDLSENYAAGIGLMAMLIILVIATAIFIFCGMKNAPYDFLEKEPFEMEYGVLGMVKERQKAYRGTYIACNIIGACLCILSPIPLLMGAFTEDVFFTMTMLTGTILLAGIGSVFFIISGIRWASMQKLLEEGEYAPSEKKKNRIKETVGTIYWLAITAIYLGWSFSSNANGRPNWKDTWIVWPIAGVLFAAVMSFCNLLLDRGNSPD